MIDRKALRLSAVLLVVGFILYVVVGLLHPDGPANNHAVVFAEYASSASWTAVHLGQFAGMAVIIAGLVVLYSALDVQAGGAAWVARLGAVAAAVALGLYGVLQAVDGVALKQAVDAWVSAPKAEKAARFASAETIRWLEWGARSYQSLMFGLALILLGSAVALTARLPRGLGYLMGLSGLAYLVQGWVLGSEGRHQRLLRAARPPQAALRIGYGSPVTRTAHRSVADMVRDLPGSRSLSAADLGGVQPSTIAPSCERGNGTRRPSPRPSRGRGTSP